MSGECHFCHGLVSGFENDHIVLRDHSNHDVYMHEECAIGHNVIETARETSDSVAITCPKCGSVETHGQMDSQSSV